MQPKKKLIQVIQKEQKNSNPPWHN